MQLKIQLTFVLAAVFATLPWMNVAADGENMKEQHPYVFHLIRQIFGKLRRLLRTGYITLLRTSKTGLLMELLTLKSF